MVMIGGYMNFCICDLDEKATINHYVDIYDHGDAFRHVCKTNPNDWRRSTGITENQEEDFVHNKVFPMREERLAQGERQRLKDNAAREQELVEERKKKEDAKITDVSLFQIWRPFPLVVEDKACGSNVF